MRRCPLSPTHPTVWWARLFVGARCGAMRATCQYSDDRQRSLPPKSQLSLTPTRCTADTRRGTHESHGSHCLAWPRDPLETSLVHLSALRTCSERRRAQQSLGSLVTACGLPPPPRPRSTILTLPQLPRWHPQLPRGARVRNFLLSRRAPFFVCECVAEARCSRAQYAPPCIMTLPSTPTEWQEPLAYLPYHASELALERLYSAVCAALMFSSLPIHATMHVFCSALP